MAFWKNLVKNLQRRLYTYINTWMGFTILLLLSYGTLINIVDMISRPCSFGGLQSSHCSLRSGVPENIALRDMYDELLHEPIDVVYTWVNGSDPVWLKKKETWTTKHPGTSSDEPLLQDGITNITVMYNLSRLSHNILNVTTSEVMNSTVLASMSTLTSNITCANGTLSCISYGHNETTANVTSTEQQSEDLPEGRKVESDEDDPEKMDDTQGSNRYRDSEELRYSLRSLVKNAGWIRHIYIVTDNQIPYWLNLETSRLSVVTHEQIFLNKSHLPVFSSPAIEAHLHRIPGLSKKFIYFNDDVFLGAKVLPEDFITRSGTQKLTMSWDVPKCAPGCSESWIGDGFCDKSCNVSSCNFDFPDCVNGSNVHGSGSGAGGSRYVSGSHGGRSGARAFCSKGCPDTWLGDRTCDQRCKNDACGWDLGDCGLGLITDTYPGVAIHKDNAYLHYFNPRSADASFDEQQQQEEYPYSLYNDEMPGGGGSMMAYGGRGSPSAYGYGYGDGDGAGDYSLMGGYSTGGRGYDSSRDHDLEGYEEAEDVYRDPQQGNLLDEQDLLSTADSGSSEAGGDVSLRSSDSENYNNSSSGGGGGSANVTTASLGTAAANNDPSQEEANTASSMGSHTDDMMGSNPMQSAGEDGRYLFDSPYSNTIVALEVEYGTKAVYFDLAVIPCTFSKLIVNNTANESADIRSENVGKLGEDASRYPFCALENAPSGIVYDLATHDDDDGEIVHSATILSKYHLLLVLLYHGQDNVDSASQPRYPYFVEFTISSNRLGEDGAVELVTATFKLKIVEPPSLGSLSVKQQMKQNLIPPGLSAINESYAHVCDTAYSPEYQDASSETSLSPQQQQQQQQSRPVLFNSVRILENPVSLRTTDHFTQQQQQEEEEEEDTSSSSSSSSSSTDPPMMMWHGAVADLSLMVAMKKGETTTNSNLAARTRMTELYVQYAVTAAAAAVNAPSSSSCSPPQIGHETQYYVAPLLDVLLLPQSRCASSDLPPGTPSSAGVTTGKASPIEFVPAMSNENITVRAASCSTLSEWLAQTPLTDRSVYNSFIKHTSMPFSARFGPQSSSSGSSSSGGVGGTASVLRGASQQQQHPIPHTVSSKVLMAGGLGGTADNSTATGGEGSVRVDMIPYSLFLLLPIPIATTATSSTNESKNNCTTNRRLWYHVQTELWHFPSTTTTRSSTSPAVGRTSATEAGTSRSDRQSENTDPAPTATATTIITPTSSSSSGGGGSSSRSTSRTEKRLSEVLPVGKWYALHAVDQIRRHQRLAAIGHKLGCFSAAFVWGIIPPVAISSDAANTAGNVTTPAIEADHNLTATDVLVDNSTALLFPVTEVPVVDASRRLLQSASSSFFSVVFGNVPRHLISFMAETATRLNPFAQAQFNESHFNTQEDGRHRRRLVDTYAASLIHVNRLYSKEFGSDNRKVPAHVPHMIDRDYINEMQLKWPEEWNATSQHRFRSTQDMQYSFSYYYYLVNRLKNVPPSILKYVSEVVDSDQDRLLNKNEFRTLAAMVKRSGSPTESEVDDLLECVVNSSTTYRRNVTDIVEHRASSAAGRGRQQSVPGVSSLKQTLFVEFDPTILEIMNCSVIVEALEKNVDWDVQFPSHVIQSDKDLVAFEMIGDNYTLTLAQLDSVRQRQSKFVCINDNMRHPSHELQFALHSFYESFFPERSMFELKAGTRNPTLYVDEYQSLKLKQQTSPYLDMLHNLSEMYFVRPVVFGLHMTWHVAKWLLLPLLGFMMDVLLLLEEDTDSAAAQALERSHTTERYVNGLRAEIERDPHSRVSHQAVLSAQDVYFQKYARNMLLLSVVGVVGLVLLRVLNRRSSGSGRQRNR